MVWVIPFSPVAGARDFFKQLFGDYPELTVAHPAQDLEGLRRVIKTMVESDPNLPFTHLLIYAQDSHLKGSQKPGSGRVRLVYVDRRKFIPFEEKVTYGAGYWQTLTGSLPQVCRVHPLQLIQQREVQPRGIKKFLAQAYPLKVGQVEVRPDRLIPKKDILFFG